MIEEKLERSLEPKRKSKEHRPKPVTPGTKEWYELSEEEHEYPRRDD